MTPKQKKQGEAEAISKLADTAEELKKDFPELLTKYPYYTRAFDGGIHVFKILSDTDCIVVTNAIQSGFYGIEKQINTPDCWREFPRISEHEFYKQKDIVLKKLKAL